MTKIYHIMEKVEMKKYIVLALLVMCMGIGLVACKGKEDPETGTDASQSQSMDYRKFSIVIPDDITTKDFMLTETNVLLLTNDGIISINYEGEMDDVIPLAGSDSFISFSIDEEGNFNILATSKREDGTTSLTVHQYKNDGSRLPRTPLKGSFAEEEDNPYILSFLAANGYYYIQSMYGVCLQCVRGFGACGSRGVRHISEITVPYRRRDCNLDLH